MRENVRAIAEFADDALVQVMIDGDSSEQVEILRAELAELRQRLELYREAFGECIGQCGDHLIAHVETLVRKLEDAFFTALDKRFAALTARLDLVLPDKPRANDTDERDDGGEQLPNPSRRTH